MEQTIERMTATRFKLEERFTHVTFIRTNEMNGYTEWIVTESNGKELKVNVSPAWEIENLFAEVELRRIKPKKMKRLSESKLKVFYECMSLGVIATDHRIYRKWTENQLREMKNKFRIVEEIPCYCGDTEDEFFQNHGSCRYCYYL